MSVVRSRHEAVCTYRVLAYGQTVVADRLMCQVRNALEYLGASDLEQRCGRSRVYAARHLRNDAQFGCLKREHIELDACDLPDELPERRVVLTDFGSYDLLETRRTVGDAGLLVPDGDAGAFADEFVMLADDAAWGDLLARRARDRARALMWNRSESALLAAYARLGRERIAEAAPG